MADNDIPIEKVENVKAQAFAEEYKTICEKYGYEIFAQPAWVGTNHGSFELSINVFIGKSNPK
jgi:hypothetical protein